jgi:hypothetical protein
MFGFLKTPDLQHPQLGTLRWSRGCWRGEVALPGHPHVPLVLFGSRKGPSTEALSHASALLDNLAAVKKQLQHALFEHYEPYAEAVREGQMEPMEDEFPVISSPEHALEQAEPEAVLIIDLDGQLATELCYRVPWDEEHTLGARFRGERWVELCGSTLVP